MKLCRTDEAGYADVCEDCPYCVAIGDENGISHECVATNDDDCEYEGTFATAVGVAVNDLLGIAKRCER
jgi:hypothetical protein